jgi:hypothetical protein
MPLFSSAFDVSIGPKQVFRAIESISIPLIMTPNMLFRAFIAVPFL